MRRPSPTTHSPEIMDFEKLKLDSEIEWKEMTTFFVWEEKLRIFEWPKVSSVVITSYFLVSIFLFFLTVIFSWYMATLNKDCAFQPPLQVYRDR